MDFPCSLKDYLGGLKQALYEERSHLRMVRRRCRSEYEEGAFKNLSDSLRHMIRDFKRLEEPFLERVPPGDHYEKGIDPYRDDYYEINYRHLGLRDRISWVRERSAVIELSGRLSRIQARRTARQ